LQELPESAAKPLVATIPVAVGSNLGQTRVVGMKFATAGPIGDSLCIGFVRVGDNTRCQTEFVSLAPFLGRCFVEYDGIAMQTQALPQICQSPPCLEGYVWCHVTEKGSIRFLRRFEGGVLEDTGLIPHEMLDECAECYFPAIQIWSRHLEADLDVSIKH
jgi:hypothetical protein